MSLKPILGPSGSPYIVTSRDPIAAEHLTACADWHHQAKASFAKEHDPSTGRHTAPRFCRGAIRFEVHANGKDYDKKYDRIRILPESVWWQQRRWSNPSLYAATSNGSWFQQTDEWIVEVLITLPEAVPLAPVLALGGGGRNIETIVSFPNPTTLRLYVHFYTTQVAAWGGKGTFLLFGA